MIHIISNHDIVSRKYDGHVLQLHPNENFHLDDYLICAEEETVAYYNVSDSNEAVVSAPVFTDICDIEYDLFCELFRTYREAGFLSGSNKEPLSSEDEKIKDLIRTALFIVKKHGHINDFQEDMLNKLFVLKTSKKELLSSSGITIEDINSAYASFVKELEYCYTVKNRAVFSKALHKIEQFNTGRPDFIWNVSDFSANQGIPVKYITSIWQKIVFRSELGDEEKKHISALIMQLDLKQPVGDDDILRLNDRIDTIKKWYSKGRDDFYKDFAKHYVEKYGESGLGKNVVNRTAFTHGLNYYLLARGIEANGFCLLSHIRKPMSRASLMKYLDN